MKLQSHSDYEESIDLPTVSDSEFRIKSRKHRQFLKQSLELGMFVSCDEHGNVLENDNLTEYDREMYFEEEMKYQQAKEKCLFEGFELKGETDFSWIFKHNGLFPVMIQKRDIEYLNLLFKREIELTPTAIKQLGL